MAVLHKEFIGYNKEIKLPNGKKESLQSSKKELRKKIKKWFEENKPNELQPKFRSQGSSEMNTSVNPISLYDEEGNIIRKYDLDDGVYFIEKKNEDNKKSINTWHDWIFDAVDNHTTVPSVKKNTCIRVVFSDGHNIDLPIYYKKEDEITLAHKSKDWIDSDPLAFFEWFNNLKNQQIERFVRYMKAWKNFREINNTSLKLPSGFEMTILISEFYVEDDNDDTAFRKTIRKMYESLSRQDGFKCIRPTTPKGEDVFEGYSSTRKTNFLNTLSSLLTDLDRTFEEKNFKKASEILRDNQFGSRFPLGEDKEEEEKVKSLGTSISSATIPPRPYGF